MKQLSVFLENKTGRINEVTKILAKHAINMHAFSMAESTDFGILRLVVSNVEEAVEVLRSANFAVMLTDVICVHCANVAGAMSVMLEKLAKEEIFIEYMYAFAVGDSANVVIRPSELEKSLQVLQEGGYQILENKDF